MYTFQKNTVTTHIDHTAVIYTCMCGSYTVYSFVYHDVVKVNCIYNHSNVHVYYTRGMVAVLCDC